MKISLHFDAERPKPAFIIGLANTLHSPARQSQSSPPFMATDVAAPSRFVAFMQASRGLPLARSHASLDRQQNNSLFFLFFMQLDTPRQWRLRALYRIAYIALLSLLRETNKLEAVKED